jgi:hypothetical protein
MHNHLAAQRAELAIRSFSPEMAPERRGMMLDAVIARRATLALGRFIGRRIARPATEPATSHSKLKWATRGKAATAKVRKRLVAKPRKLPAR